MRKQLVHLKCRCPLCSKKLGGKQSLKYHLLHSAQHSHSQFTPRQKTGQYPSHIVFCEPTRPGSVGRYVCVFCWELPENWEDYKSHIKYQHLLKNDPPTKNHGTERDEEDTNNDNYDGDSDSDSDSDLDIDAYPPLSPTPQAINSNNNKNKGKVSNGIVNNREEENQQSAATAAAAASSSSVVDDQRPRRAAMVRGLSNIAASAEQPSGIGKKRGRPKGVGQLAVVPRTHPNNAAQDAEATESTTTTTTIDNTLFSPHIHLGQLMNTIDRIGLHLGDVNTTLNENATINNQKGDDLQQLKARIQAIESTVTHLINTLQPHEKTIFDPQFIENLVSSVKSLQDIVQNQEKVILGLLGMMGDQGQQNKRSRMAEEEDDIVIKRDDLNKLFAEQMEPLQARIRELENQKQPKSRWWWW